MIIGADIFHEKRYSSIVSVSATMDQDFTEYYSVNDVQKRETDAIMRTISDLVIDCVRNYNSINKTSPDNIIFFRDGIGMG